MRKFLIPLLVIVSLVCGYITAHLSGRRREERSVFWAVRGCPRCLFRQLGEPRRSAWKKAVRGTLENWLSRPWREQSMDYGWGTAFAVLKGPHTRSWKFREGMEDRTQDEAIRYICFMIEFHLSGMMSPTDPLSAFTALSTYPQAALSRNEAMVKRAVAKALSCSHIEVVFNAGGFLASQTSQPWAHDLSWHYLRNFQDIDCNFGRHTDRLSRFLVCLQRQATKRENQVARKLLVRFVENREEMNKNMSHLNRFIADEVRAKLEKAGFRSEAVVE